MNFSKIRKKNYMHNLKTGSTKLLSLVFVALFSFAATNSFAQSEKPKKLKPSEKVRLQNTDVKNLKAVPLANKKALSKEIQQREQISARANVGERLLNKRATTIEFDPKLKTAYDQVEEDFKSGRITAKEARLKKLKISKANTKLSNSKVE